MRSQSWKPVAYLGTTIGAVIVVLAAAFGVAKIVNPHFSMAHRGAEGRIIVLVAAALAYGAVRAATYGLKRKYGRQFGTYLDDPDADTADLGPGLDKRCPRCGTRFAAYHNDAHREGFCSQACREAFAHRPPSPKDPLENK